MRVAFDTRPVSDPQGVGRYTRCLLGALHDTAAPGQQILETHRPSAIARSHSVEVFHSPWMSGAMLHSPCPMVVTIHGLGPLKRRSELLRSGLRLRLRHLAVQRAVSVIVPTQVVAADAVRHLGLEEERILVIAEAADEAMYPREAAQIAAVRERLGLPPEYLVWVGGLQHPDPGRHIAELVAESRSLPLVLVGSTRPWAHELADVILTGRVSDEDLAAIYSGARALVLPSDGEGFGLPAVEALACGTPVVAFRSPALVEVLGERATFVETGDMRGLIEAAEGSLDPAPAPPEWSWHDAARATWRAYAAALAESEAPSKRTLARRRQAAHPGRIDGLEPR